jgi:hypothetical protein
MHYFVFPALIVLVWLFIWWLRYTISRIRVKRALSDILSQRQLSDALDKQQVIEKVKTLYLHSRIDNVFINDEYISFEDIQGLSTTWNVYFIKFSSPSILRYRGFIMRYRINLEKLESLVFFLSN